MDARIVGVHEDTPGRGWGREFVSKKGGGPLPESTTVAQLVKMVLGKVAPHTDGCVVSIKAPMAAVARGAWDTRLLAVGEALRGRSVIVVVWHEPEDDLKPQVFVPGHNRALEALKAGWSDLQVGYAGMMYQWRPGSPTTRDPQAWAKELHADWYLADVYFGKTFPSSLTLGTHPGLQRWLAEMVLPYGRRWGLAEWGRRAEPDRPAGFAADFDWLTGDPVGRTCSMTLVWGTAGTEADAGWLLDEPAIAAVEAGFARLAVPAGYRLSPLEGFYVSLTDGCLVAADLVAEHL